VKQNRKWFSLVAALVMVLALGACGKKKPPAPPPAPPPPPPTPTASLSANPTTVQKGQPTTLSWRTENATDVTIDPGGKVDLSGQQQVTPQDSTTYRLVAKGPGGQQEATARVTVEAPPPPPPPPVVEKNQPTLEQDFNQNVHDVYFDYDAYNVRGDAQQTLQADAQWLKAHPNAKIQIEGHCDERGSTEYNLTLGDNRARAVRDALAQMGVNSSQLSVISFGKEKPFCSESNEQCWQQNRRGHFVLGAGSQ